MKSIQGKERQLPLYLYYVGLISVILIWGTTPVINSYVFDHISPPVASIISCFTAAVALLPLIGSRIRELDGRYLAIAIPTGVINSLASLVQKIGLVYTTPARYAFLENLSCVVVPIVSFILIRKKPGILKSLAAVLCLGGCFILAGADMSFSFGIGEMLCALAGVMYGINIAATGAFATKLFAPLYVFIHMCVGVVMNSVMTMLLNVITVGGKPLEPIRFEWNIPIILTVIVMAVIANTVCWTLRTNVMKRLDASVVAVMMPFSAVVTSLISIAAGLDSITPTLVTGAIIVLIASIISGIGDSLSEKRGK